MADALDITTRALALRPTDVAAIHYYHAVASYNLKQYDAAEKSARQALDADSDHEIPRAEYLLGLALAAKGDRVRAVQHLEKYAADNPLALDAPEAQEFLAKLLAETDSDKP
jgi:tetratricopeptide (TPR) repeat protein